MLVVDTCSLVLDCCTLRGLVALEQSRRFVGRAFLQMLRTGYFLFRDRRSPLSVAGPSTTCAQARDRRGEVLPPRGLARRLRRPVAGVHPLPPAVELMAEACTPTNEGFYGCKAVRARCGTRPATVSFLQEMSSLGPLAAMNRKRDIASAIVLQFEIWAHRTCPAAFALNKGQTGPSMPEAGWSAS